MSRTSRQTEQRILAGVPVTLVRGGVKNYNLRVRPDGSVRVSMPARGSVAIAERLVAEHKDWILARQAQGETPDDSRPAEIDPASDGEALRERLLPLIDKYEAQIGVHASRWRLKHMVSRWGSCNVKTHAISLNTELAHMPQECLESVVVHELCHLLEPSHNAHFHALMDEHYPAWREARAYLNRHPPRRRA